MQGLCGFWRRQATHLGARTGSRPMQQAGRPAPSVANHGQGAAAAWAWCLHPRVWTRHPTWHWRGPWAERGHVTWWVSPWEHHVQGLRGLEQAQATHSSVLVVFEETDTTVPS